MLAGSRRLDRRVEREQIGLECDLIDDADDVRDLLAGTIDSAHRCDCGVDDIAAPLCLLARRNGQLPCLAGVIRRGFYAAGHLLHARGRFFEARGLLLGPLAEVHVTHRDLLRA